MQSRSKEEICGRERDSIREDQENNNKIICNKNVQAHCCYSSILCIRPPLTDLQLNNKMPQVTSRRK